jgi:hypothetical protein
MEKRPKAALFRCFPDDLIEMERTNEPWVKREPGQTANSRLL